MTTETREKDAATTASAPEATTSTAMTTAQQGGAIAQHRPHDITREQIELLKRTVAQGTSDDEFAMFMQHCRRTGLDPFLRQVHAVKRYDSEQERYVMSIQTGIDGFRLIAERTQKYAPGRSPTFTYGADGRLISATAYVKKFTPIDGTWHEVSAEAFYDEYVQLKRDGTPNRMWKKMPHVMLSKVAEALALRKAFPADFSGMYIAEEMMQSENDPETSREQARRTAPTQETRRSERGEGFVPDDVIAENRRERKPDCVYVEDAKVQSRSKPDAPKKWTLYGIVLGKNGQTRSFTTFDSEIFETAEAALRDGTPVEFKDRKTDRQYRGKDQYELVELTRVFYADEQTDDSDAEATLNDGETVDTETGEIIDAETVEDSTPLADDGDDVKAKADEMIQQMKGAGKNLKNGKAAPKDDEQY